MGGGTENLHADLRCTAYGYICNSITFMYGLNSVTGLLLQWTHSNSSTPLHCTTRRRWHTARLRGSSRFVGLLAYSLKAILPFQKTTGRKNSSIMFSIPPTTAERSAEKGAFGCCCMYVVSRHVVHESVGQFDVRTLVVLWNGTVNLCRWKPNQAFHEESSNNLQQLLRVVAFLHILYRRSRSPQKAMFFNICSASLADIMLDIFWLV